MALGRFLYCFFAFCLDNKLPVSIEPTLFKIIHLNLELCTLVICCEHRHHLIH